MSVAPQVFVLSWSFSQRTFDVEPLQDVLARNLDVFRRHCGADFIPLAVYQARDEARAAQAEFENWLPDRKRRDEDA